MSSLGTSPTARILIPCCRWGKAILFDWHYTVLIKTVSDEERKNAIILAQNNQRDLLGDKFYYHMFIG